MTVANISWLFILTHFAFKRRIVGFNNFISDEALRFLESETQINTLCKLNFFFLIAERAENFLQSLPIKRNDYVRNFQ